MGTSHTQETPPTAMLMAMDVASLLRCSTRTVYRLADAGKVPPPCRLSGLVRWSSTTINAWIAAGCPAGRRPHGHKNQQS